ncbi:UDP-N-acetylglucosamine 2-epimerase [Bacteroides salyersiae CL02T12C01]|jgi:UDP-N-acetylglucosamine 2-epimerase|uniref:UDP-N-acetylglucosamine 2-epimerase n=1 Tax=Bacteroides salyersiae CL02T12C01 TaxID=997887 RepID=I9SN04_9BACE|nr:UDP-N-acetylglucosamine 2-epimerase (non-hydrolyzing) [Bacteroides salyersiae]EIY57531.1 UDP-N-acetylglucosamine 2-epimerase [Bacteroides salyersiae CL02T12C01]UBD15732.1 UDP-N-acetylglucosamine 2-epimerase (non-hydrolyzing) [Bacteroides salyersiae]
MGKLKLMTIIGTRPEIIRLSEVIKKCDLYFDQILVHTGQNYDYSLNQVFFEDLGLREPDYYLNVVGKDLGETMGNVLAKSYQLMVELKPDAVMVLGDTNSCLSVISAKRLHIPTFHMEAGNRCFDENLPEETNRRIVDHISDLNMCYSEHARRYLNYEGTAKERTYVTGSPMAEVLSANLEPITSSDILERLGLEKGKYILLSAHREENIDTETNFFNLMNAVNAMAEKYDMPILYSCHPRSKKHIEQRGFKFDKRVIQNQPLGFHDYNQLQLNAFCVVSDSGTLPEESAFFSSKGMPIPAVCIRTSTERPEALDKGVFILAGITAEQVLQAVDTAVAMNRNGDLALDVPDYMDENVSTKVVKLIQSYTGVINKMVWRKY